MAKKFWDIKNQADAEQAEMLIYGDIANETWWGDETTPKQFAEDLAALGGKDLTLRINSPGGDVFAAHAVYNQLKAYKTQGYYKGCNSVSVYCVSCNHCWYNSRNTELAHADKNAHKGNKNIALAGIAGKRWQHSPIGNVVHGIGHSPEQVADSKKGNKSPAFRSNRKEGNNYKGIQDRACKNPGLIFSSLIMTVLNYDSHKRIINCIPNKAAHNDCRNCSKLGHTQLHCVLNVGHKIHAHKGVSCIASGSTN